MITWIPITESLPPEDQWVLMWFECYKCRNGYSHNITEEGWANAIHHRPFVGKMKRRWITGDDRYWIPEKPTHWTHLPEPPSPDLEP